MRNRHARRSVGDSRCGVPPRATNALGAAVVYALYGVPLNAWGQEAPAMPTPSSELSEITVTASRREEKLEAVPTACRF